MKVFIIIAVLFASTLAAPGVIDNQIESDSSVSKVMKYFGSCSDNEDITSCLAIKGITALNRAARASNIKITEGVVLARDPTYTSRAGKAVSENEIVSSLPTEPEQRSARLYDMALDTLNNFLASHTLQFKFPADTTQEVSRAIDEGRGKLKKLIGPLLMGLIGKKMLAIVPIFIVGLALLAFKALVVSKIALLLAVVLLVSKIAGGGGSGGGGGLGILGKVAGLSGGLGGGLLGGGSSGGYANSAATAGGYGGGSQGWSSGGGGGSYPYARSYDVAQDLAYSGQAQTE
ncbi:CLUMA_CG000871, isoform A [Clunio marinus]|uniref:CLUMA_CG000871, isoform A n=1 Tax=Clunio marinus TaxID=568069 RepID=A0A1J1HKX4_9DIPT|nr:CLUMA_CG000871, isoform A [Clunio marinus]